MLIGEYKYTIDTKKRLALPAKFRKELGAEVVITKGGFENCLTVYPVKEWEAQSEKYGKLPESQPEARALARVKLGGAVLAELDQLGRILIPEYLKQYASLDKNVVICGLSNKLEIWDAVKWNAYRDKAEKEVGDFASKLKDLGI